MRQFWGESLEVRVFFRGGHVPPQTSDLYWRPPWGLFVPVLVLVVLLFPLCLRFYPDPRGLVALLSLVSTSVWWGGGYCLLPMFPPSLLRLFHCHSCL